MVIQNTYPTEGGQLLPGSVIRHYRRGRLVLPGVLPGVTWSVTWCYLVLPRRCLALHGFLFWSSFFFVVPKHPRFSNSNFWKKINFHLEMLPGPTPVVVTCLPGPPSASQVLTLSYVLKRKKKRLILSFANGGLRYHPANFDLKLCKLPTSGRRAATTATETTSLRTRQYVLTPTYVPGCCTETEKLLQIICNSCFLFYLTL